MNIKVDILEHKSISTEEIKVYREAFTEDESSRLLMNIVNNVGIEKAGTSHEVLSNANHLFNNKIDDWDVMNQKQSGRCWIFAGMNLYKPGICKKLDLKDIKLSANYVQFWDFFEKSNLFFNQVESTASEPLTDRLVQNILNVSLEGGWWDMFTSIVNKYGIVPEQVMPDTHDASKSQVMCRILSGYLRTQAKEIRALVQNEASTSELKAFKQRALKSIYRFLVIHLGVPPEKFDWVYENEQKEVKTLSECTPLEFVDSLDEQDCVTLINDPREERPFMKHYTSEYSGTIEGELLDFLNVEIDEIKLLVKKMIDAGRSVWMSCDVSKMANHKSGIFDADLYNYSELLGLPEPLSKADRLNYCDGGGNHAMLFTGYHEVDGEITKWRIENSWGAKKGNKGYYEMSNKWFDEHVYTSLIDKKFLNKEQLAVLAEPIVKLMPWELPY